MSAEKKATTATLRDAMQAAALAGEYRIASEMAGEARLSICLRCGKPLGNRSRVQVIDAEGVVRNCIGWVHASCAREIAAQLKVEIIK